MEPCSERLPICPVGVVVEGLPEDGVRPRSHFEVIGLIRFYEEYAEALDGLEQYSHAWIITFLDRAVRGTRSKPRGSPRPLGSFATRSPTRPNPIGFTLVEILGVKPPFLRVKGLDAYPGTPVLDVKPYDYMDIVCRPRVPEWARLEWESKRSLYREIAPWLGPCPED